MDRDIMHMNRMSVAGKKLKSGIGSEQSVVVVVVVIVSKRDSRIEREI